jgi:hypothetical protein
VSFKLSGTYEAMYGIRLSATAQHFTGFPEDVTVLVTGTTVALTQVSQSIRVQPRGDSRLPDTNMLDISAKKNFRYGRYSVEPGVDVFNVLNASPIQLRITQLGTTFGRPSRILAPRLVRFSLNMTF